MSLFSHIFPALLGTFLTNRLNNAQNVNTQTMLNAYNQNIQQSEAQKEAAEIQRRNELMKAQLQKTGVENEFQQKMSPIYESRYQSATNPMQWQQNMAKEYLGSPDWQQDAKHLNSVAYGNNKAAAFSKGVPDISAMLNNLATENLRNYGQSKRENENDVLSLFDRAKNDKIRNIYKDYDLGGAITKNRRQDDEESLERKLEALQASHLAKSQKANNHHQNFSNILNAVIGYPQQERSRALEEMFQDALMSGLASDMGNKDIYENYSAIRKKKPWEDALMPLMDFGKKLTSHNKKKQSK